MWPSLAPSLPLLLLLQNKRRLVYSPDYDLRFPLLSFVLSFLAYTPFRFLYRTHLHTRPLRRSFPTSAAHKAGSAYIPLECTFIVYSLHTQTSPPYLPSSFLEGLDNVHSTPRINRKSLLERLELDPLNISLTTFSMFCCPSLS